MITLDVVIQVLSRYSNEMLAYALISFLGLDRSYAHAHPLVVAEAWGP